MEVKLDLDRELLPFSGGNVVLAVRCEGGREAARSPLALAAVLDRSTSMRGAKLEAVKTSARRLVAELGPEDRLALVGFAAQAQLLATGTPASREALLAAIDGLSVSPGTNLAMGLEVAGAALQKEGGKGVKRVLLLTDGGANAGVTERPALAAIARSLKDREIATTALGFGLEYDELTLAAIADGGGGRLYHVNGPAKLEQAYAREVFGLRSTVARGVELAALPESGVRVLGSRNAFPARRERGALVVSLSELRGGEAKVVLLDLAVPAVSPGSPEMRVALVRVRWTTTDGEPREETRPLFVKRADDATAALAEPNGEVLAEIALLDAAHLKERALADEEAGDPEGGSRRLANSLVHLSPGTARSPALDAELARLAALAAALGKGRLEADYRKEIVTDIYNATHTVRGRLDLGDAPPI